MPFGAAARDTRFSAAAQLSLAQTAGANFRSVAPAELRAQLGAGATGVFLVPLAASAWSHEQIGVCSVLRCCCCCVAHSVALCGAVLCLCCVCVCARASASLVDRGRAVALLSATIDALPARFVLALTADAASGAAPALSFDGRRRHVAATPSPTPAPVPHDHGLAPPGLYDALLIVLLLLAVVTLGFCHMMCLQTPTQFVMPSKKLKAM